MTRKIVVDMILRCPKKCGGEMYLYDSTNDSSLPAGNMALECDQCHFRHSVTEGDLERMGRRTIQAFRAYGEKQQ
jgi:hypothetical protein